MTKQAEGTGIGLYLVKSLVSIMGGTITLDSKVGVGSTFTVKLPITKPKRNKSIERPAEQTDARIMQAAAIELSDIYMD